MAKLSVVGTGPGSPDYVTLAAKRAVQNAQIVVGAERSLNLFERDFKGLTLKITAKNLDDVLKRAIEAAQTGKSVAVLSTGDPGFSGLLGSIIKRSLDKNIELDVVPGVSSLQICAARMGICWDNAEMFTFHNDASEGKKKRLAKAVKAGKVVFLLPEPNAFPPSKIADYLIKRGTSDQTAVTICENLTLENERVVNTTLAEACKQSFSTLSVMVVNAKTRED